MPYRGTKVIDKPWQVPYLTLLSETGCAAGPENTDWIVDCAGQDQVYPLIKEATSYLKSIQLPFIIHNLLQCYKQGGAPKGSAFFVGRQ
ncbi:MAG: hypothetical protein D3925_16910 [Candidatus Electrothrix sp. AR5]|nr:hypothetical protein [Candidatus Electrothrix sp. AR5]